MQIHVSQPRRPWFAIARSIKILADDVALGTVRPGEQVVITVPDQAGLVAAGYMFFRSDELVAASLADGISLTTSFQRPPERAFLTIGAALALLIVQVAILKDRPSTTIIMVLVVFVSALGIFGVVGRRHISLRPTTLPPHQ